MPWRGVYRLQCWRGRRMGSRVAVSRRYLLRECTASRRKILFRPVLTIREETLTIAENGIGAEVSRIRQDPAEVPGPTTTRR